MDGAFLGVPLSAWVMPLSVVVAVLVLVPAVRGVVRRRLPAGGASDGWRAVVAGVGARWMGLTTLTLALAPAAVLLTPDPRVVQAARVAAVVVLTLQVVRFVPVLLDWGLARVAGRRGEAGAVLGTLAALRWVLLVAVDAVLVLLALQNLGVDVTSLIAGMGIGGIAVALAMQNILGDLFASLTIALDRPFAIGDFIVVGSEMGAVEHIGLKTTRVRSLSGEQLVFGNADLLGSRIRNYKRMTERRVVLGLRVARTVAVGPLGAVPALVRGIIEGRAKVRFDRCHLAGFGDSSYDFEAVYYLLSPDYNEHMDIQQAVLLGVLRAFEERGVPLAVPAQVVRLEGRGAIPAGATASPPATA